MTLLLDEDSILGGKELNYIDKKFGPDAHMNVQRTKKPAYQNYVPVTPQYGGNYPMNYYQGMGGMGGMNQMNQQMNNNYGMPPYQGMYQQQQHQHQHQPIPYQQNMYYGQENQS